MKKYQYKIASNKHLDSSNGVGMKFVIFFSLFFCFSSWGFEIFDSVKKPLEPSWKANFSTTFSHDHANSVGFITNTELFGKFKWNLYPRLSIHGELLLVDRKGFIQSTFDRSDRTSSFYFTEGYFEWNLFLDFFYLHLGNKNQVFFEAPLLISDKTFFSVAGEGNLKFSENISLKGIVQAAVPNSAEDFIARDIQLEDKIPLFYTASTFFQWEKIPFLFDSNFKNNLTFFYFTDPPSPVAEKSLTIGNTPLRYTSGDAKLKYKFHGLHNTVQTRFFPTTKWIFEAGYDYLYNFGAPKTYNKGERLFSSLYYDLHELMEIKLTGAYFAIQSDAAVAFYNTEIYGHNNRKGWFVKLEGHFYDSGITFGLSYTDSQAINPEISFIKLKDAYSIIVSVGTNYVRI